MTFMDPAEAQQLLNKLSGDLPQLERLCKAKSDKYISKSVDHALAEKMLGEGWEEYGKPLKTKTRLRKLKSHSAQLEDDIWCQLYRLGYSCLNVSGDFNLPFGRRETEKKQIDVIAVNEDSILLVECKSSARRKRPPSFKTEFEALKQRLNGYRKALKQLFGSRDRKVKFIFATRNLQIDRESADAKRLADAGGFLYNDNSYDYIESLLKSYKDAALYQFMAILFKGQDINKDKIEVAAIEGKMGGKAYYMFSLEPALLLKMGFVLHRTRANEAEMPTYQRLLVPNRLKGISKFIDDKGFFPNSVILNFSGPTRKIEFQGQTRASSSRSRSGTLKIPNAYAIAYIIDGQHRIYGYANSRFRDSHTIPVVSFVDLKFSEQLEMFMNINENQKAVSPALRITLEEDLYWNASRLDSRMKALRSSVIRELGEDQASPLFRKIALGEDRGELKAKPFADSLLRCGLLPAAKGNKFVADKENTSVYDTRNHDYSTEMYSTRSKVVSLLNACYQLAEEHFEEDEDTLKTFIVCNRGTFAFISLIGSLNSYLTDKGELTCSTKAEDRFDAISKYLSVLFKALSNITDEDRSLLLGKIGSGAENTWFRMFQNHVNKRFSDYEPAGLLDWKERQDKELQDEGRGLGTEIEKYIKKVVISNLKVLFGDNWDLEIGSIQRVCEERAKAQMEKNYREGLGRKNIPWTDQFLIKDYKKIIEKYWTREPDEKPSDFKTFEEYFALDIGDGFNSKAEKLRWLSKFNSYRSTWAHEGTKESGLNQSQVNLLREIHDKLIP